MKTAAFLLAATMALGAAVPAMAQSQSPPRDTGNMAYPAPLPQGNISTTAPGRTRDTGSAATPAPLPQGNVSTTTTTQAGRKPTDTGNMAYPAPVPAGTVGGTVTK